MVYQNSNTSVAENDIIHLLVAQVSRAFFDAPYVVLLDRMMKRDVWHPADLGRAVGLTDRVQMIRLLARLQEQRMIRSYDNLERPTANSDYRAKNRKNPMQKRTYYYLDYHDFINVVRYRLAAIRQSIESDVKKDTTRTDYKCRRCGREYAALDAANLRTAPSTSSDNADGEFNLICEYCSSPLDTKLNDEEKVRENERMQRFNAAVQHIQRTLQKLEKIDFTPIDPKSWLLEHVKETLNIEIGPDGKQIILENPFKDENILQVKIDNAEDDEKIKEAKALLGDAQRQQNALPDWHTHSTITGEVTALGKAHLAKQQQHVGGLAIADQADEKKAIAIEADLAAHYARLEAEAKTQATSSSGPSTTHASGLPPADDEEEDMEEAGDSDQILEAARNTIVYVAGKQMPYFEVTENDHGDMTDEEYMAYAKLDEEIQGLMG